MRLSNPVTSRSQIRQLAVQTLFQLEVNQSELDVEEAVQYALEAGRYPDEGFDSVQDKYLYSLIEGVMSHIVELDDEISQYLVNWSLPQIARIDLTILRLAFYEILFQEDIPDKVAIDEAVDLAKFFSNDRSRQFINGVLNQFLKTRTQAE